MFHRRKLSRDRDISEASDSAALCGDGRTRGDGGPPGDGGTPGDGGRSGGDGGTPGDGSSPSILRISVSELAGVSSLWSGSFSESIMMEGRLQLGQRMHSAYQKEAVSRHRGYSSEKWISWETSLDNVSVVVSGRIDGLYREESGRWVVEELKSWMGSGTSEDLITIPPKTMMAFEWQCSIYMHLWALKQECEGFDSDWDELKTGITGFVVLMDVLDGSLTRVPVDYDPDACRTYIHKRLMELVSNRREEEAKERKRRAFSANVVFPFSGFRLYQKELVENVEGAFQREMNLGLSAPTGIGKTAAALFPALRCSFDNGKRLFFVTAKVSQQELALETIEAIFGDTDSVTAVQIEAKERSCPEEEMLCVPGSCKRLREASLRMAAADLPRRLMEGGVVRAGDIREEADRAGVCPFDLSLAVAYGADVLVGDLNYVFHPGSRLKRLFGRDLSCRRPRPWGLIVDEAHNLYPRALDFLSPLLERSKARVLAEGCMHGPNPIYREFLESLLRVDDLFQGLIDDVIGGPWGEAGRAVIDLAPEPWAELGIELELWLLDYLAYIKSGGRRPLPFVPRRSADSRRVVDPAIQFCMEFFAFVETAEARGDEMVTVLSGTDDPENAVLKINCLDPSRYLSKRLEEFSSTVSMSATMEPLSFYMDVLGMNRSDNASCAFPSPFPAKNRLLLVDDRVSTRYKDRGESLTRIAPNVVEMAAARDGVHLVFFPSYEYLASAVVLMKLAVRKSAFPVEIVQVANSKQAGKTIKEIRRITGSGKHRPKGFSRLVCTVMGGVMSEGVDYPGEMAVGAYIIGPGLPAVTFERHLMKSYHDRQDGHGFEYAYIHPGLTRVVQAAGRVIRSEQDRGVIVLMGERFTEAAYRSLLPEYWCKEMIVTQDPVRDVREFWQSF